MIDGQQYVASASAANDAVIETGDQKMLERVATGFEP